jgi:peptidoglycan hydrolase CwlO-like protein
MTATPPEASPTSTISLFFMGEEKPFSEVDQMQRDFETKIKNKHEDILKLNKKKDMKTKKINKYLVSKFD